MVVNLNLGSIETQLADLEQVSAKPGGDILATLLALHGVIRTLRDREALYDVDRVDQIMLRFDALVGRAIAGLQVECAEFARVHDDAEPIADLDAFDRALIEARGKLGAISTLRPESRLDPEFQRLQTRMETLANRLLNPHKLIAIKRELAGLWEQASNLDHLNPQASVDLAKQARDRINAAIEAGGVWSPHETGQLYLLQGEARERYDDFRRRHEVPTTKDTADDLVPLIIEFAERAKRNPGEIVTFFDSAAIDAVARPMRVEAALPIAQDRLIGKLWIPRVEDYIRSARDHLSKDRPREALAALNAWRDLPGLYDERVGVSDLPGNTKIKIASVEKEIQPALQAYQAAEELVRQARLAAGPVQAYGYWQQARSAFPQFPDLQTLEQELVAQGLRELDRALNDADATLRTEDFTTCGARLRECNEIIKLFDRHISREARARYTEIQEIFNRVQPLVARANTNRLVPDDEALLQDLEQELADTYWPGWIRLQRRLAELQTRGNLQALLDDVRLAGSPDASWPAIEALIQRVDDLIANPPEGLARHSQRDLEQAARRLAAWSGFVLARDELDKVSLDTGSSEHGQRLSSAPDLEVVRQGLKEALGDREAAQAVRERRLSERLRDLEHYDQSAEPVLRRIEEQLTGQVDYETARQICQQCDHWLSVPTSYRRRFIEIRRQAAQALLAAIDQNVSNLLNRARATWYRDLDMAQVEAYTRSLSLLRSSSDQREELLDRVAAPVKIARIYTLAANAASGLADWDMVREEWNAAVGLIHHDVALHQHCLREAREAQKQSVLKRVQHIGSVKPDEAMALLRTLCDDPMLQDDWSVWLALGQHQMNVARNRARAQVERVDTSVGPLLAQARESLNRAQMLASALEHELTQLSDLLRELGRWETLASASEAIWIKLGSASLLSAASCKAAYEIYDTTLRLLSGSERQILQLLWGHVVDEARAKLNRQARATDRLEQVEAYLAMICLAPDDPQPQQKLSMLMREAVRKLQRDIKDMCFDSSAEHFLARYSREHHSGTPADSDVIQLQRDNAQQLATGLYVVRTALQSLPRESAMLKDLDDSLLDDEERRISEWMEQLSQGVQALMAAQTNAQNGLQQTELFERARYILRQPHKGALPELPQVPEMFRDRNHPSYRACLEFVQQCAERRTRQLRLKKECELCLDHELVDRSEDLPSARTYPIDREILEELRRGLQRADHPIIPLEAALQRMATMREEEPQDACGVQEAMVYSDPDEEGRRYESLDRIQQVISHKVAQIRATRRWLRLVSGHMASDDPKYPGIVDWLQEKQRIERLRDTDPIKGLPEAQRLCKRIRDGDQQGLYVSGEPPIPRWSLMRAIREMAPEALLSYLRGALSLDEEAQLRRCSLAQRLDLQREQLRENLRRQVQETRIYEVDLGGRAVRFRHVADKFMNAHARLLNSKRLRAGDITEWQQSANALAEISPGWPDFQKALYEMYSKHGIDHPSRQK